MVQMTSIVPPALPPTEQGDADESDMDARQATGVLMVDRAWRARPASTVQRFLLDRPRLV